MDLSPLVFIGSVFVILLLLRLLRGPHTTSVKRDPSAKRAIESRLRPLKAPPPPRPEREYPMTGWQLICCALAVPVVYFFEHYFYEAIFVVFWAGGALIGMAGGSVADGFTNFAGSLNPSFLRTLLLLPVIIVVGVILLGALLIWAVILMAIWVVVMTALWLVQSPGPPRYFLDLFFVCFTGTFLYGTLFPVLWRAAEPLVALTLGELMFQRARARVFGVRARYSQPLYLAVGAVALAAGGLRIVAPVLWMADAEWAALVAKALSYQH